MKLLKNISDANANFWIIQSFKSCPGLKAYPDMVTNYKNILELEEASDYSSFYLLINKPKYILLWAFIVLFG